MQIRVIPQFIEVVSLALQQQDIIGQKRDAFRVGAHHDTAAPYCQNDDIIIVAEANLAQGLANEM